MVFIIILGVIGVLGILGAMGILGALLIWIPYLPLLAVTSPYWPLPYFKFSFNNTAIRYAARATQLNSVARRLQVPLLQRGI